MSLCPSLTRPFTALRIHPIPLLSVIVPLRSRMATLPAWRTLVSQLIGPSVDTLCDNQRCHGRRTQRYDFDLAVHRPPAAGLWSDHYGRRDLGTVRAARTPDRPRRTAPEPLVGSAAARAGRG